MKSKGFPVSLLLVCLLFSSTVVAQRTDTVKAEKVRKNVIKVNLTSLLVYKTALLVEYERVLSKSRSFSVQAGFVNLGFGSFLNSDSMSVTSLKTNSGFSLTADYRFYLPKENKDGAPHGVYIGPYIGYVHLLNEADVLLFNAPNTLKTEIDVISIGGELGYQFLLGKRWTLDFVLIGPSITNYRVSMELEKPIDASHLDPVYQKFLGAIAERFPAVGSIADGQTTTFHGKLDTWFPGFRYSIHVGFRL